MQEASPEGSVEDLIDGFAIVPREAAPRRRALAAPALLLRSSGCGARETRAMKLPFAGPLPSNDSATALPSSPAATR